MPTAQPAAPARCCATPTYAATLRAIGGEGADAFYDGAIAAGIVAAVRGALATPACCRRRSRGLSRR